MRIALLTDVHEDANALQTALSKIKDLSCDKIIFLGDIAGINPVYYPNYHERDAHKCLSLLREHCDVILAGNHDLHHAQKLPFNYKEIGMPEDWYSMDILQKKEASGKIFWLYDEEELIPHYSHEDIEFLRSLPQEHLIETERRNILFSHFLGMNQSGSIRAYDFHEQEIFHHLQKMMGMSVNIAFCGHAHPAGVQVLTEYEMIWKGYRNFYLTKELSILITPPINDKIRSRGFAVYDEDRHFIESYRF